MTGSPRRLLTAAMIGFFIVILDSVIVSVALPAIRDDLGGGIRDLQWVVESYVLAFAALLLSAGSITDRFGANRVFAGGLVLFAVSSAACGLAPDILTLQICRVVQGAAAASMTPASMALVANAFQEPRARSRAFGVWSFGAGMGSASAPLLGGLLTLVSWRLIFLVNVPVVIVALWLLRRSPRAARQRTPVDLWGQATAIVAMVALTFAAIEAGTLGGTHPAVAAALILGAASSAAFIAVERTVQHPMVPLNLFAIPPVRATLLIAFAFMAGFYGLVFLVSLYLQQERGLTPLEAGLVFTPMMVIGMILTPVGPRVAEKVGQRAIILTGLCMMSATLAAIAALPSNFSIVTLSGLMLIMGIGSPAVGPVIYGVLADATPSSTTGVASGLLNTSRQLGAALSVAVFGALVAGDRGFDTGMDTSLYGAAGLLLVSAVIAARALPSRAAHRGLNAPGPPAPDASGQLS